jgi:hypothetical protein
MTRITNAEHVLALLRAQLERAQKARGSHAPASRQRLEPGGPLDRLRAMGEGALSDDEAGHLLIAGLLSEEFGEAVSNDPNFRTLVEDVLGALRRDERGALLLAGAIEQLKPTE